MGKPKEELQRGIEKLGANMIMAARTTTKWLLPATFYEEKLDNTILPILIKLIAGWIIMSAPEAGTLSTSIGLGLIAYGLLDAAGVGVRYLGHTK